MAMNLGSGGGDDEPMIEMNMISSTSITSISGVVLISIIMSSSFEEPTFMAMSCSYCAATPAGGSVMNPTL